MNEFYLYRQFPKYFFDDKTEVVNITISRLFTINFYNPKHTYNKEHKLEGVPDVGAMEGADLKKLLQKAVVHYHPDRIDVEKFGKKRKVLGEEITKYLTRRYESFKL
jgi:hypothetical protein